MNVRRTVIHYALLILLALTTIAPLAWMAIVSLHPPLDPTPAMSSLLAPRSWHPENYSHVLTFPELPVWRFAVNTVVVTLGVVVAQLTLCSLAAFGFARLTFPGRDTLFFLFLVTMMVPAQATIVPLFVLVQNLGWLNSYLGLIVPYPYISTAFGTFLLRQAMVSIPRSLDDAGRLDGCGDLRLLWHLILPSCRPALATVAALAFIWTWGDFYWPLLATSSMEMRTLEVGLSIFRDSYGAARWPLQMAAATITLTPVLIVFLALQRLFVRTDAAVGIRG